MKTVISLSVLCILILTVTQSQAQPNGPWGGPSTCHQDAASYKFCPTEFGCQPGCLSVGSIINYCSGLNKDAYCDNADGICTCCPHGGASQCRAGYNWQPAQ